MSFDVYIRKAVENGKVIFPGNAKTYGFCLTCDEHKNGEKLKCLACLRKSKSAHGFASQYLNDPIDLETVEFKPHWFRRYELTPELRTKLQNTKALISIDPAVRLKETSDYSAIVVTKQLPDGHIYVVDAIQKKMSPTDLMNEVFKLVAFHSAYKVILETTAAQVLFLDLFKREMVTRKSFFSIEEVINSTRETKAARVRGLIPYYENGMIYHRFGLIELEDQLQQFPRNTHDDIIDALAHQVKFWGGVKTSKVYHDDSPHGSLNWWKKQTPKSGNDKFDKLFGDLIR